MKTMKFNARESANLSEREMEQLRGGDGETYETRNCNCGCKYADAGGSSYDANGYANARANKDTTVGGTTTHTVIIVTKSNFDS